MCPMGRLIYMSAECDTPVLLYLFNVSGTYGRLAWLGLAPELSPQQTAINNVSSF